MKKKTMTHTPAYLRDVKAHLYGQCLWLMSQESTTTKKIQSLNAGLSVGKSLHDFYVSAGYLEKLSYGVYRWSLNTLPPSRTECVAIYKAQTLSISRNGKPSVAKEVKPLPRIKINKKASPKTSRKVSNPHQTPKRISVINLLKRFFT